MNIFFLIIFALIGIYKTAEMYSNWKLYGELCDKTYWYFISLLLISITCFIIISEYNISISSFKRLIQLRFHFIEYSSYVLGIIFGTFFLIKNVDSKQSIFIDYSILSFSSSLIFIPNVILVGLYFIQ